MQPLCFALTSLRNYCTPPSLEMADINAQIAALEKRAAQLEGKLDQGLVNGGAGGNDQMTVSKLTELKKLMMEDKAEAEAIRAERDGLLEENEKLKKEVEKLNYRVLHMNRTIESLDKK